MFYNEDLHILIIYTADELRNEKLIDHYDNNLYGLVDDVYTQDLEDDFEEGFGVHIYNYRFFITNMFYINSIDEMNLYVKQVRVRNKRQLNELRRVLDKKIKIDYSSIFDLISKFIIQTDIRVEVDFEYMLEDRMFDAWR